MLISSGTNEKIIRLSQEYTQEETCYPVKLIHGHMMELVERGVDYIFMPRIHTMRHDISEVNHNYGCVYMQTAPTLAANAIRLEKRGIALPSPVLSMELGKKQMVGEMIRLGGKLGHAAPKCMLAMAKGAAAFAAYGKQMEADGQKILESLRPDKIVFVIITRQYGLRDPGLNMGVERLLTGLGYQCLSLNHLPAHNIDTSPEYPNIYWPFGQHIPSGAELVRQHPNLYAVYLTNHGCSPDTMLSYLFREQVMHGICCLRNKQIRTPRC